MKRLILILSIALAATHTAAAAELPISQIQGADHKTTIPEADVVQATGVVTGRFGQGFFMQALDPDASPATSEGIFVFLGNNPSFPFPERGSVVTVTGYVTEFPPVLQPPLFSTRDQAVCGTVEIQTVSNQDRATFLLGTQISRVSTLDVTGTAPLPAPVSFQPPGSTMPIAFADKPGTPFDPAAHPRDYFESLEGMRVVIEDAMVVSRKDRGWDQFWVAPAASLDTTELTAYGLPLTRKDHVFPELVQVHKAMGQPAFALPVGSMLGNLTGIMTYENGVYMVVLDDVIDEAAVPAPQLPAVESPVAVDGFRIATFNAENLSASGPVARFAQVAGQIVGDLGAPDVVALQEVQDDDGPGSSPLVSADGTLEKLIDAIVAAGGPKYTAIALDPIQPNTDGGEPGANIRTVFLVDPASGATFGPGERLFDGEDRCDANKNPFQASRRPLLVEATIGGKDYVLVNVHLSSKLGDQGLYSNAEDPQPGSTARRLRQADMLRKELESRYGSNPPTIILMGDFNDHADGAALAPFHTSSLGFEFQKDHRGDAFTVSYAFNGLREAIDLFVIGGAKPQSTNATYFNLNADALQQVSDHNPVVLTIE